MLGTHKKEKKRKTKYARRDNFVVKSRRGNAGTHMDILTSCCRVALQLISPSHMLSVWEQEDGQARTILHEPCMYSMFL